MDKKFSEGKESSGINQPGPLATAVFQHRLNTGCEDTLLGDEAGELLKVLGGTCALLPFGISLCSQGPTTGN